ncbi:DUF4142 domain-containing protein [Roseomonas frigidaquae]|uniref:DUF4142 domain-containing protein n=1 Tax=Falsiroseomonas frigidaquae TaxID=487318 RepID=A0ABX1EWQ2_9PROT|nr:DUF4142 domain-containing protein [Falsiroseomonas frigidaquae]NKE44503.1 DUF4142 domain-containing protein [Falsiroseomonas frigidaquae]
MNRRSLFLAGAMLLPAMPLMAQDRPTTVLDLLSGTGVGANVFVERATIGNNFEIQSSQILLEKSTHPQIRQFAEDMIAAHTAMGTELRAMPEASTRQPSTGDDRMQSKLASLRNHEGDELNRWYVQMQVEAHEEAATLYESFAQNGEVPALKAFAQKHLPAIRMHLQRAQALQAPRAE